MILLLPGVLKADQRSHNEKYVNWNEAAIRELLTIGAEAEIVRQFSEMVSGALYTSHERSRVFTGSLRVVCERTHRFRKITGSVNEPKSDHPGSNHGTHFPCIFQNGCVKEAYRNVMIFHWNLVFITSNFCFYLEFYFFMFNE